MTEIKGRAHVYGDSINTDVIIAGKYTKTLNMQDLADHCMEDLDPNFKKETVPGDVVVGGANFGNGSSREQAPLALKYSGISAVLARSFARVFFRNAVNVGLPVVICDTSSIQKGDLVEVDLKEGKVIVNGACTIPCDKLPDIMQAILEEGGLSDYLRNHGEF